MSCFQILIFVLLFCEVFVEVFVDIYEYFFWVVEKVYDLGIDDSFNDIEGLYQCMVDIFLLVSCEVQLVLINVYLDFVGKVVICGELIVFSIFEQVGVGIYECSVEEFVCFIEFNDVYKVRFGFFFIKVVKGSNCYQILVVFEECIQYFVDEEFVIVLVEINKIVLFCLQQF